jgi:cobalamin-dependent methionine synthase I
MFCLRWSNRSSDEKAAYLLPLLKRLSKLVTNQGMENPYGNRKGDVHDIGKNIVSVVLACNN